jgi:hypothetical protein
MLLDILLLLLLLLGFDACCIINDLLLLLWAETVVRLGGYKACAGLGGHLL